MIVTGVDLYSDYSEDPIELSFRDVRSVNPYRVTGIQGLDADDIVPRYYASGAQGDKYFNFALRKKDVVVQISLNPRHSEGETYSSLRDHLYRAISSSRSGQVRLVFKNDDAEWAELKGFIGKVEASHFSKTPDIQLTINCIDPMLRSIDTYAVDTDGMDVSNPVIVDAVSTAPHGLTMALWFTADRASYTIQNKASSPDWTFTITPTALGGFDTGDIVLYTNDLNSKGLTLLRGASTYQLADSVVAGSIWPMIFPGSNAFFGHSSVDWASIQFKHAFWGV
jgi:hypothetical protein